MTKASANKKVVSPAEETKTLPPALKMKGQRKFETEMAEEPRGRTLTQQGKGRAASKGASKAISRDSAAKSQPAKGGKDKSVSRGRAQSKQEALTARGKGSLNQGPPKAGKAGKQPAQAKKRPAAEPEKPVALANKKKVAKSKSPDQEMEDVEESKAKNSSVARSKSGNPKGKVAPATPKGNSLTLMIVLAAPESKGKKQSAGKKSKAPEPEPAKPPAALNAYTLFT